MDITEDEINDLRNEFNLGGCDDENNEYVDNKNSEFNCYEDDCQYDYQEINESQQEIFSYYEVFTKDNVFVGYAPTQKFKLIKKQNICEQFDDTNKKIILNLSNEDVDKIGRNLWGLVFENKIENICTFCGCTSNLCKYTIISNKIIKYFPINTKPRAENKIIICDDCKFKLNNLTTKYFDVLSEKYGVEINSELKKLGLASKYNFAKMLLFNKTNKTNKTNNTNNTNNINSLTSREENEKKSLKNYLRRIYLINGEVSDEFIQKFIDDNAEILNDYDKPYKNLFEKVTNFKQFKKEWKDYIFSKMDPVYMIPDVKQYFDQY